MHDYSAEIPKPSVFADDSEDFTAMLVFNTEHARHMDTLIVFTRAFEVYRQKLKYYKKTEARAKNLDIEDQKVHDYFAKVNWMRIDNFKYPNYVSVEQVNLPAIFVFTKTGESLKLKYEMKSSNDPDYYEDLAISISD